MNEANLKVLTNIIGAVESGGQIYGKRRYNQYSPPYHSTPKEHTITIGWYCAYGHEARTLIRGIYDADPASFQRLDTCSPSIQSMLSKDWISIRWNPSSLQKTTIINLIDSAIGHKVQDQIFIEKMKKLVDQCRTDYPAADVKAQMMYCEIKHLGGAGPVKRIFDSCKGKYDLDTIMASLVADQKDTSSSNQVGDKIFWSRHVKCRQFIDQYAVEEGEKKKDEGGKMTEAQAIDKVIGIAESEVGYLEKKSAEKLYDKTANAGSGNYTKFNKEMHELQPRNMDYPAAWCDAFVDWCFYKAFGAEIARKVLCGDFDDYTVQSARYYKDAGRWTGTPKRGDQAFFKNSQRICHTGIVYKAEGSKVYTIEGNAGNRVQKKSYTLGDSYIAGFGRPNYAAAADAGQDFAEKIKAYQTFLNAWYSDIMEEAGLESKLVVDGDFGTKTRNASLAVWKYMANKYYGGTLTLTNRNFLTSCKAVATKITDAEVAKHPTLEELRDGICYGRGYKNLAAFRKAQNVSTPADTWHALFN